MLNIKALSLAVSAKKIVLCFPYISLYKIYDNRGGPIFGPREVT